MFGKMEDNFAEKQISRSAVAATVTTVPDILADSRERVSGNKVSNSIANPATNTSDIGPPVCISRNVYDATATQQGRNAARGTIFLIKNALMCRQQRGRCSPGCTSR